MGDQGGVGGGAGAPLPNVLPDIPAAKSINWNVELDRGLRLTKQGAPCEAILKTGARLLWWSQEPIPSAATATFCRLEPGQDKTFANAMVLRLAESFRTGNNATRLCILKVFFFVSKNTLLRGPTGTGLLKRERIAGHPEVLRRVKTVMDSGDPVARALALRMIGSLGEISAHSADVHRLVIEALESPHNKEVEAALYTMGCLCELSLDFAEIALKKLVDMVNVMETPPEIRLCAIRVFSKMGLSPYLSLQAHQAGKALMLRLPTTEIVSTMMTCLTGLVLNSVVITRKQVELLMAYLSSDPRATVRAVALQCLSKLASQAARAAAFNRKDFAVLASVIEDSTVASVILVLVFQVLKKLSGLVIMMVDNSKLHQILLTVELSVLHYAWSVTRAALECLVTFGCNLTRLASERERETSAHCKEIELLSGGPITEVGEREQLVGFAERVGLLLCDQLAMEGVHTLSLINELPKNCSTKIERVFDSERLYVLQSLVVQLVRGCPDVTPILVESIALLIEVFTREQLQDDLRLGNTQVDEETSDMSIDNPKIAELEGVQTLQNGSESDELFRNKLEFVLTLCRCLCVCVRDIEADTALIVFPKLLASTTQVSEVDASCHILRATLPALLRIWSMNRQTRQDGKKLIEILVLKCIHEMKEKGEFWAAYKVGVEAAKNGLWAPVYILFRVIAKKVQSEGCYIWLLSLSHLAEGEALLSDVVTDKEEDDRTHGETRLSIIESAERSLSAEESGPVSTDGNRGCKKAGYESEDHINNLLCMFRGAAAKAIPLLRQAGSSLAAGVCSNKIFEFQRWLVSIRLRMVQYVVELSQVLTSISSHLAANVVANPVHHDWQAMSSFRSAGEKVSVLCNCLVDLMNELDLLSLSFVGLDQESVQSLYGAAVSCSLIALCTGAVFSFSLGGDFNKESSLQHLSLHLRYVNCCVGEEVSWSHVSIEKDLEGFRLSYVESPNDALLRLCNWAIKNVWELQRNSAQVEHSRSSQETYQRAVQCLQLVVSDWSQLLSPVPRFFFCTRPRTGVELSVAQAGSEDLSELTAIQGSALLLSLCAQISNFPLGNFAKIKTLFCVLSVQGVESTSLVEEDLYAGWKLGWHEGQASDQSPFLPNFSLLKKLMQRATCRGAQETLKLENDLVALQGSKGEDYRDGSINCLLSGDTSLVRSLVVVTMDERGLGFAPCLLDVAKLQCGLYQLSFHSVGLDTEDKPWVLSSHFRVTLKITPST